MRTFIIRLLPKYQKGFALIEIIFVIAIMAILMVVVMRLANQRSTTAPAPPSLEEAQKIKEEALKAAKDIQKQIETKSLKTNFLETPTPTISP